MIIDKLKKIKLTQFLVLCILTNLFIPLLSKKLQSYNAIINTVDIYSYKSIIRDRQINNAIDELNICDPRGIIENTRTGDVCSLFDERFEYIETEEEAIFISRLNFFPTRIDITSDSIDDMQNMINSFICINSTLIPEFSYLLHSTEYHFHKNVKSYKIPNFIDIQHHVHISKNIYQRKASNKNEPSLNITIGPNRTRKKAKLLSRYPKIDYLVALRRAGINTFNYLPLKRVNIIDKYIGAIMSIFDINSEMSAIMSEWLAMLTMPIWGESDVINIQPNRQIRGNMNQYKNMEDRYEMEESITNDFYFQASYTLLLLGRLSDVGHTTLFRCPSVYFMSEGMILEGSRIWILIAVNSIMLYHFLWSFFRLRVFVYVSFMIVSLIVYMLRPLLYVNLSFKLLLIFALLIFIRKVKDARKRYN